MSNSGGAPGRPSEPTRRVSVMTRANIQTSTLAQESGGGEAGFANTAPMRDTELLRGVEPGSQVWTTYIQETKVYDSELVERWNRGLELTLVFAALFSAIVTAFVLESVKMLRPDSDRETTAVLMDMSQTLRSMASGQPLTLQETDAANHPDFRPSSYSIWINSLFFLSLSLSIATSLVAMLAKQWCYNFLSGRTGDAIDQVEKRQGMFDGIESWNMGIILEVVPVLMHLSLGVFWAGLVLYLWDINIAVAVVVTILAGVTACFYFGTMFLSAIAKNCPFVTPQGEWVRHGIKAFRNLILGPNASRYNKLLVIMERHLRWLASTFQRSPNDPHSLGNRSSSVGFFAGATRYFSTSAQQDGLSIAQLSRPVAGTQTGRNDTVAKQNSTPHAKHPAFILESLSWLITHSRDSTTIGTAIGAWAIAKLDTEKTPGKFSVRTINLEQYIKSFLVSRFSACFKSSPELGVKLQLLDDGAHLSLALDYCRWMTYFANSSLTGIKGELEALLKLKAFGQYSVIHLGLAFASLAESQFLSGHDAEKVVMWLSAFTSLYHMNKTLFTDRAIATMIEGIAAACLRLTVSGDSDERQALASNIGIPHLVRILSEADTMNSGELQIRSSVLLSLAVFALKAKFSYPFDPGQKGFDSEAIQLVDDYHSGKISFDYEGYAPFVVFSLVGLIYPKSKLNLDEETTRTVCKIIQETYFFGPLPYRPTTPIQQITNHDSFRHHMTKMLIETMIPTPATRELPIYTLQEDTSSPSSSLSLQNALMEDCAGWDGSQVFPSLLQAICKLIRDHFQGTVTLYPGVLVAATDLLLREIKLLHTIDFSILISSSGFYMPMLPPSYYFETSDLDVSSTGTPKEPDGRTIVASFTLARIMAEATDPRCFKAVVRAIIYHSKRHSVDTIVGVIAWFADDFCTPYLASLEENNLSNEANGFEKKQETLEEKQETLEEKQERIRKEQETLEKEQKDLLVLSCYSRLLASMIRDSSDPEKLSECLRDVAVGVDTGGEWQPRIANIRKVLDRLVDIAADTQVSAFAVAGLAVWDILVLLVLPVPMDLSTSNYKTTDLLPKSWDIIEKHSLDRNQFPPEAIEVLLDTTVRLAAILPSVPKVTPAHAQIALELIARIGSEPDARLKSALAVAVTFWGLSLDEPGWKFWTAKDRKAYWEQYRHLTPRTDDTTALLLIGLSRILFHYSTLQLSHESIKTIAHDIHHHMSAHSGDSYNLALDFLSPGLTFDVRRHVRESVWQYLEETEIYKPFSRSTNDVRELLRMAVAYDGGEGYGYEAPQPFIRTAISEEKNEDTSESYIGSTNG